MSQPNPASRGVSLTQHISNQQRVQRATGEFTAVLAQINLAGKIIARALSQAGIFSLGDAALTENFHEELPKRMERFAYETFVKVFSLSPFVTTLACEGRETTLHTSAGKYVVFVDPLDGATNLHVNGVTGSIFSVYRRQSSGDKVVAKDLLPKGTEQVASGYIMYGPSTLMVYSAGNGVNTFKLDTGIGEFLISQQDVRIPERGITYSCNEAHFHEWHEHTRRYIERLRQRDAKTDKHYSSRYAGCLVFNFHRTLMEGGVCMYPEETADRAVGGKRRLIYQCNPLAFIAEQAGGKATTGTERILRIQPGSVEERSAMIIGSPYEVLLYEDFAKRSTK